MKKNISISQFNNMVRQMQSKQKQAIDTYNQKVRQIQSKQKQVIDRYNSEVRKYNSRVRSDKQRIIGLLNRLKNSSSVKITYKEIRNSSISLNQKYNNLESQESILKDRPFGNEFLDLSEKENANSLELTNLLEEDEKQENKNNFNVNSLKNSKISEILLSNSEELSKRWDGALYSLNPENPDASRHFCTSAREVYIQILDGHAPDDNVRNLYPNCEKTDKGFPTRKIKIIYMLEKAGINIPDAINFVDENVNNVLKLFKIFNEGTHGSTGKFSFDKLLAIKQRVEDGIIYLDSIGRNG